MGVAFGAAGLLVHQVNIASAIALAVGIGIQNYPEGMAISLPLRREGMSMGKSFFYGQFSGMVEPIAGVFGAAAVIAISPFCLTPCHLQLELCFMWWWRS